MYNIFIKSVFILYERQIIIKKTLSEFVSKILHIIHDLILPLYLCILCLLTNFCTLKVLFLKHSFLVHLFLINFTVTYYKIYLNFLIIVITAMTAQPLKRFHPKFSSVLPDILRRP